MRYLLYIVLSVFFISIVSCSPKLTENISGVEGVFFPAKLDTASFQFLTSFSVSSDIEEKQSRFEASIVGENEILKINRPFGVDIFDGKLYSVDLEDNSVKVIDLINRKLNLYRPKLKIGNASPINVYADENGDIYLVNPVQRVVSIYDSELNYKAEFGVNELKRPIQLAIKDEKIFVADLANHRVNIYDKLTKEYIDYFPKTVVGNDDYLNAPSDISVSDERIYISDVGANNVKVYSLEGEFIQVIGSHGDSYGQFSRPKGTAVDKDEFVYVLDAGLECAQIFNKEGELFNILGGAYQGPGYMYLPIQIKIDYDNKVYFEHLVDKRYHFQYLILVSNQYGPEKISVYAKIERK